MYLSQVGAEQLVALSNGGLRMVASDETVVTKEFVAQAHRDSAELVRMKNRLTDIRTALNTESERSSNWANECRKAREAHRRAETAAENLKAENADLKDLLKQVTEYAIVSSGTASRIRPEDGVRSLTFRLGAAPHLNIEIQNGVMVPERKQIKVWAPAPPNPDEPILKAINSEYPSTAAPVLLQRLRRAGLDITLKDQSKGVTLAVTPSLRSVS